MDSINVPYCRWCSRIGNVKESEVIIDGFGVCEACGQLLGEFAALALPSVNHDGIEEDKDVVHAMMREHLLALQERRLMRREWSDVVFDLSCLRVTRK